MKNPVSEIETRDLMILFQTDPTGTFYVDADESESDDFRRGGKITDSPIRDHYYTQDGHWRATTPEGEIEQILQHWDNLGYDYSQIKMCNGHSAWIRHN